MDASESYSWLVFTLFIASAIFLAVFVALQWASDGPKGHRIVPVLLLYRLLYSLYAALFSAPPFILALGPVRRRVACAHRCCSGLRRRVGRGRGEYH